MQRTIRTEKSDLETIRKVFDKITEVTLIVHYKMKLTSSSASSERFRAFFRSPSGDATIEASLLEKTFEITLTDRIALNISQIPIALKDIMLANSIEIASDEIID